MCRLASFLGSTQVGACWARPEVVRQRESSSDSIRSMVNSAQEGRSRGERREEEKRKKERKRKEKGRERRKEREKRRLSGFFRFPIPDFILLSIFTKRFFFSYFCSCLQFLTNTIFS